MRWSFQLARIAGIDVKIHATFFLLLAWFGYVHYRAGGASAAVMGVVFVCLVFVCVLLHEFGHALAARRYGIKTPDITLLPIGGVARLEKMPDNPFQEVVVALAGPAVNVVIAFLLWAVLGLAGNMPDLMMLQEAHIPLPVKLLFVNITLVIFNLIPAFPMDGGRILRALLAMRMDYARATHIAATTGQVIAVGFLFVGLTGNPMFILIAVFVFFGAQNEAAFADLKSASTGMRVATAMVTQYQALPVSATCNEAVEALLRTSQHDFPIIDEADQVCGVLTRDDLIVALRKSGPETPVADVMRVDVPSVHYAMHFDRAFAVMQESGSPALPVLDSAGRLIGLFTTENVGELMMVKSALDKNRRGGPHRLALPPPLPTR
ncbi:MAG TPA: site-2 protease family protein [Chthoniobacteraceae bacterium]|jgi:stage IV sporulation protein FB